MNFTYINSKNLKISLTREDLLQNGLEAEQLDYSKVRTKRFIWELLERASCETGFDAEGARLLVRVFPSGDGGAELFVSKKTEKSKASKERDSRCGFVFVTGDSERLFLLCERLKTAGFSGSSSLYENNRDFVLVCENDEKMPSYLSKYAEGEYTARQRKKDYSFAVEYGDILPLDDSVIIYISEHCTPICGEKAVERLANN